MDESGIHLKIPTISYDTVAKLPLGSGTSSKYISVVWIEECLSQRDRWLMGMPFISRCRA